MTTLPLAVEGRRSRQSRPDPESRQITTVFPNSTRQPGSGHIEGDGWCRAGSGQEGTVGALQESNECWNDSAMRPLKALQFKSLLRFRLRALLLLPFAVGIVCLSPPVQQFTTVRASVAPVVV